NVRVIGGTNKGIKDDMERGSFRKDLYHRFGIKLTLPTLRERDADIPLLATYFLDKYCKIYTREIKGIAHEAMTILTKYKWPGNIRELEEVIKSAINRAGDQDFLYLNDFLFSDEESIAKEERIGDKGIKGESEKGMKSLKEIIHEAVKGTLKQTDGNKRKAAEILGIAPQTLYNILMKEAGIKRPEKE
ncbi:MAG: helix-turn-helix domain-containing protein, partial [Candidatus Margulisiibacteriota bacterium]